MTIDKILPTPVELPLPGQRPAESDIARYVLQISDSSEISEEAREVLDTIGSADGLPGEGEGKLETGKFGFCQNCGTEHQLASARPNQDSSREDTSPIIDGQVVPELYEIVFGGPTTETHSDEDGHGHTDGEGEDEEAEATTVRDPATTSASGETLSEEDQKEVEKLRDRYREVRAHEQAHAAAGGSHVRGGIKYEYPTGPDGRRYAVGGEASIDTSPVPDDPQKTIQKAQQIRRAMAPPNPRARIDRSLRPPFKWRPKPDKS